MNELLGKHTAVLGTTGSGKSAAVAALLHSILEVGKSLDNCEWHPRIIILDPHNEYASAFPVSKSISTEDGTLKLPYWLLNFQETLSLLVGKTEFVATSQANIVKMALSQARKEGAKFLGLDEGSITVDSPIPYKLDSFISAVESDKPSQASRQESHNSLLQKLEVLRADGRLKFLMSDWEEEEGDSFEVIIRQIFTHDNPPRVVDLSGVPNEVAGVTSAVIARTLFNVKVWQTEEERRRDPIVLVCEEAHRYVPNSGEAQYEAAQESIRQIAKEGRKYGVGLLLVSQRPSEVEATVLSQCNSWLVLRITNESDRNHVRNILPDSLDGLTKMLSGLRRQEAIFVGQAATLPSRVMVRHLNESQLPASHDIDFVKGWQAELMTGSELNDIALRWRYQRK